MEEIMLASVIRRLNERRATSFEGEAADSGFTLIELMVVLLIMAILLAIAIPTFLGVKGGAQDRSAQSDLNTALTNAKAIYGNNQSYGTTAGTAQTQLTSAEASLSFNTAGTTLVMTNILPNPGVAQNVYVATSSDGNGILMVNRSQNGDCWAILTNESTEPVGTYILGGTAVAASVWPITQAGTYYLSTTATPGTGANSNKATCTIPASATIAAAGTQPASSNVTAGSWQQNAFTSAA
jgi:type IV pilus assembly protein PilA